MAINFVFCSGQRYDQSDNWEKIMRAEIYMCIEIFTL